MSKTDETRRLFGTDGIRGVANQYPMTAEIALALGRAVAERFRKGGRRCRIVIGKDTRLSGYMIEYAMVAGFASGLALSPFVPIIRRIWTERRAKKSA